MRDAKLNGTSGRHVLPAERFVRRQALHFALCVPMPARMALRSWFDGNPFLAALPFQHFKPTGSRPTRTH